jgi:hypothetical protein
MIYTYPDGTQVDLSTGETVGQTEAKQVAPRGAPEERTEIYSGGAGTTAVDALKQLSFGFNSALFSLPDAVIKQVGSALGVQEQELPTFTSFFNRGATAPKNAIERYANAIGQGAGIAAPFTGVLGAVARTKALTGPITAGAPVAKTLAKETLDFIRANPKAAVALDLGFGAAYTGVEQAVEEYTEPGLTREVLKATVPLGATVAVPLAANKVMDIAQRLWSLSPTANVIRAVRSGSGTDIPRGDVEQAVSDTIPKIPFFKGPLGWVGNWYGSRAQKGISKSIVEALEQGGIGTQEQIQLTKAVQQFAAENGFDDKFAFNLAEFTLNPSLRRAYNEAVANTSGEVRAQIIARNRVRDEAFESLAKQLTPESQLSLQEALVLNSAERTRAIDDALKRVSGLEESERLRLLDAFDADMSLADIGNSLRSGLLAQREGLLSKFRTQVDELMRRPFGVRQATRVDGLPIEGIPAIPFQNFAIGFTKKYNLGPDNRWFGGEVPAPAKDISRIMSRVREQQEAALPKALDDLVHENLLKAQTFYKNLRPEEQQAMRKTTVDGILRGVLQEPKDRAILEQAKKAAEKYADVDITLPEAMDLLLSAQRFKTHMFLKSQQDREFGIPAASADQTKRFGDEVLRDVEDFIFKADRYGKGFTEVPGVKELESTYRNITTEAYDRLFPLLVTKRRPTGEFMMGDEQVVREALKSRENLRALNSIFGDNPTYARYLEKAMLTRAYESGAIGKDGLLNEQAFSRFLGRNKSVIDELPDGVQATLRDELKMGQRFADDLAAAKAEKEALVDIELDRLVKEVIRPDADTATFVQGALARPQDMRKLVDALGKDPEQMAALRRSVWEGVVGKMLDPTDPVMLSEFKRRYGKSLALLYPDAKDQRNLEMLAALQERVLAVARPPSEVSPFKTFEERLREKVGAGVGTLESTARAAAIRIISPIHAGVSIMTRLMSRQQQGVANRILLNALVDEKYATQLINASAGLNTEKGFKQASKLTMDVGGYLPSLLRNAPTVAAIEGMQAQPAEALPLSRAPVVPAMPQQAAAPRPTTPAAPAAAQGPRNLAEASMQAYGAGAPRPPTPAAPAAAKTPPPGGAPARRPTVPQMPAPGGPSQPGPDQEMYRMLFPNDFVSPMMQRPQ